MRLAQSTAAAIIGLMALSGADAVASPLAASTKHLLAQQTEDSLLVQVQDRRRGSAPRHAPRHRDRRDDDVGAAVAAGIFGMILGGMIAAEAQRRQAIEYCMRRYRSYDPYTMTYLGRDGRRYRCP